MNDPADVRAIENYRAVMGSVSGDSLIARAEEAMQGLLILSGTGNKPYFVGIPPKWDENKTGVNGFTWTLSRLMYMDTLCKAFLLTGQRRYLDKVENDLADWLDKNPAPPVPTDYESACVYHGVHNWRMLELGFRMVYTYPVVRSVLRVYGQNRGLIERIDASIVEHAERISGGSHLLWPGFDHNHYTEEINGLLAAVSMLPDHPKAGAWLRQAMEGLEAASRNQITADGSQSEGAAEYHNAVVIDFCNSMHFANLLGARFSDDFIQRLRRAVSFSIHTLAPDGNIIPFGDSDVLHPTPIQAALMATLIFRDDIWLNTVRRFVPAQRIRNVLAELYPWGFEGVADLLSRLDQPLPADAALLPCVTVQRQMDQFIARAAWDSESPYLFFSCHSPIHNGSNHAHMDQLGVIYGAFGKPLIQDPGRYTYKDCEERHEYKRSQTHSVPTVDGRDGFEYIRTFVYGPQKEGRLAGVMVNDRVLGAGGVLNNYEPVVISRTAALIDGSFLLIADTFENAKGQDLQIYFHLNSTRAFVRDRAVQTTDDDVRLALACVALGEVEITLLEGCLSDMFYQEYPSTRALFRRTAQSDTETLFFIAAGSKEQPVIGDFSVQDGLIQAAVCGKDYRIQWKDGQFQML